MTRLLRRSRRRRLEVEGKSGWDLVRAEAVESRQSAHLEEQLASELGAAEFCSQELGEKTARQGRILADGHGARRALTKFGAVVEASGTGHMDTVGK